MDNKEKLFIDGIEIRELMTPQQAQIYLRLDRQALYYLIAENKIPFRMFESERRFVRSELDNWLERSVKRGEIG